MKIEDALVILLEATVEMEDQPEIRRARKRMAQKVESLRLKRERALKRQFSGTVYPIVISAIQSTLN